MAAKDNVISKMAKKNAMFLLSNNDNADHASEEVKRVYEVERAIDLAATDLDASLTSILSDVKALQEFLKCDRGYTTSNLSRFASDADKAMTQLMTLMPVRKYHNDLLPHSND